MLLIYYVHCIVINYNTLHIIVISFSKSRWKEAVKSNMRSLKKGLNLKKKATDREEWSIGYVR